MKIVATPNPLLDAAKDYMKEQREMREKFEQWIIDGRLMVGMEKTFAWNAWQEATSLASEEITSLRAQVASLEENLRDANDALMLIALSKDGKPRDLRPNWRIAEEALGAFPLLSDRFTNE